MPFSDRVWRERGLRAAVLAGDEHAWRTWYDESYSGLWAYVSWRSAGLNELIEDTVQETWLTAVRRIRRFDPERGTFAGWLRGIAANVLCNLIRRREQQMHKTQPLNGELPSPRQTDQVIHDRERAEQIARALADIPQHYEAILQAKYLDGQSMAQIAQERNESVKAVESLLTRARQAFREAYQQ